MLLGLL